MGHAHLEPELSRCERPDHALEALLRDSRGKGTGGPCLPAPQACASRRQGRHSLPRRPERSWGWWPAPAGAGISGPPCRAASPREKQCGQGHSHCLLGLPVAFSLCLSKHSWMLSGKPESIPGRRALAPGGQGGRSSRAPGPARGRLTAHRSPVDEEVVLTLSRDRQPPRPLPWCWLSRSPTASGLGSSGPCSRGSSCPFSVSPHWGFNTDSFLKNV